MAKTNFFFERQEFSPSEIRQPYYTYLGYLIEERKDPYPISIYFGKDEIAVYYTKDDSQVLKIFSLYVAEGEINQLMLAKKVEDYAKMPLWPLSKHLLENELGRLRVDPVLLHTGFFVSYYGFECNEGRFSEVNLPGSRSDVIHIEDENRLLFRYGDEQEGEDKPNEDRWNLLREKKIKATKINFSKILLDFLFELDFANTFEDENFFRLQPHLQNNLVLDALTKKCRYLSELNKRRSFSQQKRNEQLPKPFQDDEKAWLNVCRLENCKPVFISPNSLFDDPETEVKNICFKARIGQGRKKRKEYLKSKEDAQLKNQICTFFMRKCDIWGAFRILMPPWAILLVLSILLSIPFGDYILGETPGTRGFVGLFSIGLPMIILMTIIFYHIWKGINLFKLLLSRLFLGIMLGWSVFWSTEELWKKALSTHTTIVLIFDVVLLVVIFMYVFTDISNRMYRKVDWRVLVKSINLIVMALVLSFVIGFYVIQFFAKPILENSGFLENERLYNKIPHRKEVLAHSFPPVFPKSVDDFFSEELKYEKTDWEKYVGSSTKDMFIEEWTWDLHDYVEYIYGGDDRESADDSCGKSVAGPKHYHSHFIGLFGTKAGIIYIWSILFSQFVVSILIGIVLQLLWEDQAITEPL